MMENGYREDQYGGQFWERKYQRAGRGERHGTGDGDADGRSDDGRTGRRAVLSEMPEDGAKCILPGLRDTDRVK